VLVSVAAYARGKRPLELLRMLAPFLAKNRSAVLVFVGHQFVEPEVTRELETLPAALGVGDQVMVPGWMSRPDIRELLGWASAAIINSRAETQCLAIYEALAAGVPVLISAIPALTSQFPALPAHASEHELRANLERVLGDSELRHELVRSSQARLGWADVRRHDELLASALSRLLGRPVELGA
jgi:glycosyltransferase involved in cell wall biosynthesis